MTQYEKWQYYNEVMLPKVRNMVKKITGSCRLYYEVWIDLDDEYNRWFDYMLKFPNLAAYCLAKWMIKRDKWYWSPSYVKDLEKASKKVGDVACFSEVLNESLKAK